MFDFYYQHGSNRRKLHRVKGSVCSIGSARSNDLVLSTRLIAKRHVEFRLKPKGVYIQDLGSLSGTWVNRERVVDYGPLTELDEITIGDISVWLDGVPTVDVLSFAVDGVDAPRDSQTPTPSKAPVGNTPTIGDRADQGGNKVAANRAALAEPEQLRQPVFNSRRSTSALRTGAASFMNNC